MRKGVFFLTGAIALGFSVVAAGQSVSEDDITLPVYPGAEVVMHAPAGMEVPDAEGMPDDVAMVTMDTSASVEEVLAFYRERLDGFTELDGSAGAHKFIKGDPPDAEPTSSAYRGALRERPRVNVRNLDGTVEITLWYEP